MVDLLCGLVCTQLRELFPDVRYRYKLIDEDTAEKNVVAIESTCLS